MRHYMHAGIECCLGRCRLHPSIISINQRGRLVIGRPISLKTKILLVLGATCLAGQTRAANAKQTFHEEANSTPHIENQSNPSPSVASNP